MFFMKVFICLKNKNKRLRESRAKEDWIYVFHLNGKTVWGNEYIKTENYFGLQGRRRCALYVDDIVFYGKFYHIHGTFKIKLLHDMIFMAFNCSNADKQALGYFLIGKTITQ